MDFYLSSIYSAIVVGFIVGTFFYYFDSLYYMKEFNWFAAIFFSVVLALLLFSKNFIELNESDYDRIYTIKEQYPQLNVDILEALKDNKITIGEGLDILDKTKDIENKLKEKRVLETEVKALQELEKVKQELKGE